MEPETLLCMLLSSDVPVAPRRLTSRQHALHSGIFLHYNRYGKY